MIDSMMDRKQQFESTLLQLAKNMNVGIDELLFIAKQCREADNVKTHVDGFDDMMNDMRGGRDV